MRYQIFNTREAGAKPAMSAPWQWLAFSLANLLSLKWPLCRIVDAKTGETLMEWIRADRPLMFGAENAAIASVKIGPDGSTHTFQIGSTHYGMGQAPKDGHTPVTIIEGQCTETLRDEEIHVNIWDDYYDDGFVPDGEVQETYAYVEGGDLGDDDRRAVLVQLQQAIESIKAAASALVCRIEWYDSAMVYPNLIGTEHERHLYKRWQLQMTHLPHREREQLVEALGRSQLRFNDRLIVVYSES